MLGFDTMPYYGRTLGKLCALRRVADTLLSELEQQHMLLDSKRKLEESRERDDFRIDLTSEAKDNVVLKYVERNHREEILRSYDVELGLFIQKIENILSESSDSSSDSN